MENTRAVAASSRVEDLIATLVFFGFFAYTLVCLIAYFWISQKVPLSDEDLANASWLTPRLGLGFHGFFFGVILLGFAIIQAIFHSKARALFAALIAIVLITSSSESGHLRLGILDGQAKIGCFTYQALECRKMLNLSEEGAQSIYVQNVGSFAKNEQYAGWYLHIREQLEAQAEGLPELAFLRSPFLLIRAEEIRRKVEFQRSELISFRASLAK
jgi:hypothetical protein